MYRVEFIDKWGDHRLVGRYSTEQDARAAMVKELHSKGIKPYYYRSWTSPEAEDGEEVTTIDFGSHSEFYKVYKEEE